MDGCRKNMVICVVFEDECRQIVVTVGKELSLSGKKWSKPGNVWLQYITLRKSAVKKILLAP